MSTPFILLINPWIHDFAAYDLWIKPLGLMSIAGLLKRNGFGVQMIDCLDTDHPFMKEKCNLKMPDRKKTGSGHFFKQEIPKPNILRYINRRYSKYGVLTSVFRKQLDSVPRPDAVLITSVMSYWYPGVFEVIKTVKEHYPNVPVILGGIYATVCFDHARSFSGADYVHAGPFNRKALKIIETITGKTAGDFKDNFFLYPDCSFMSLKKFIPILTSRGCPLKCSYCASSLLYSGFIQKNPFEIADEIELLVKNDGAVDFVFYDDALLVNAQHHLIPLLNEVLNRDLHVRFHVPNGLHIMHIDCRISELMIKTGFKTIRLGLEFSDPDLLRETGSKVSRDEFVRASAVLKDAGFSSREVGVYLLAGLPEQHHQTVYDSIRFVQDQGLRPYVAEYSPVPGTKLWEKAVTCSSFPISDEPLFHNNTLLPCQWEKFTLSDLDFLKRESRKEIKPDS